ncbi:MAG: hypothetical protein H6868_10160 [Rhodospirillales bacterium]|nr:hypothetical protein [Rhodospirillales bacterium]
MERVQAALHWMIVVSASSHIFCCVLPTVIGMAGLLTGMGFFSGLMPVYESFHEIIHTMEQPLLVFSAVMLTVGWVMQAYSWQIDCHDTGCHHGACAPKKNRAALILKIATVLFVVNTGVFFLH